MVKKPTDRPPGGISYPSTSKTLPTDDVPTDTSHGSNLPPDTLEANVGEADLPSPLGDSNGAAGDVFTTGVFEGTVKTESPTISETPGDLSEYVDEKRAFDLHSLAFLRWGHQRAI